MSTKEVTLDELIQSVQEKEAQITEPAAVTAQIRAVCNELKAVAEASKDPSHKVRIITDYDADGICSAMIMKRTIECMNPEANIEVVCNDRRGHYGVPKELSSEPNTHNIILDMGSNELEHIQSILDDPAQQSIVIDHHIITDEGALWQFEDDPKYLNPHCITEADGKSAEYCATGLAYRCFQELANDGAFTIPYDEKIDRTVAIYAAIGTTADVVDLMDLHGYNRQIVKQGMEFIDTANPDNTDFILGAALEKVGISSNPTTAKEIAYNMGAFLNAASRMSEVTHSNGAQEMFNLLSSNPVTDLGRMPSSAVADGIDHFIDLNTMKKAIVQSVMKSPEYQAFEQAEQDRDTGIAVFVVPENMIFRDSKGEPLIYGGDMVQYAAAINGLIAGQVEDKLDKAIIVLSKKGDTYTGSGRAPEGYDSLNAFMKMAMQEGGLSEEVRFGGHEAAIGISSIPQERLQDFMQAIEKLAPEFSKSVEPVVRLKLTEAEVADPALILEKLRTLEPIGQGNKLPPTVIEGAVEKVEAISKRSSNPRWKNISVTPQGSTSSLVVKDWNYPTYPSEDGAKTALLAEIEVNNFRTPTVAFTVRHDKDFAREHSLEKDKPKGKTNIEKGET